MWRQLLMGISAAAIVSVVVQILEPYLGILSLLLVLPMILLALWVARIVRWLRPGLRGATVAAAVLAGFLINFFPIPAGSLGARVSFYAQLAYYKKDLDAQCSSKGRCHDASQVTTLITEGFGSIIQGLARDDSGVLLDMMRRHRPAPNPLQGCEGGLVHLYGPYFHWGCG
jgi:hypothetical protein